MIINKTGTKIYYSDKSESSVEDLMDETPSNYNIPNGRLDGKSMGLRLNQKLNSNITSKSKITTLNQLPSSMYLDHISPKKTLNNIP